MPYKYITFVMNPRFVKFWAAPMFLYGVGRTACSEYPSGYDLSGYRLAWSLINGIVYVSPIGVFRLMDTVHRAEIKYRNLEPKLHPQVYTDGLVTNSNIFW